MMNKLTIGELSKKLDDLNDDVVMLYEALAKIEHFNSYKENTNHDAIHILCCKRLDCKSIKPLKAES